MSSTARNSLALVGLVASLLGIWQVFSFEQLEPVACSEERLFECLQSSISNSGRTVLLNLKLPVSSNEHPNGFKRRLTEGWVGWHFDSCNFAERVGRRCTFTSEESEDGTEQREWTETVRLIEGAFSDGTISWSQLKPQIPDNGLSIRILTDGQEINPHVSFELNTEDSDIASGPYQISSTNRDGNRIFWLAPAPYTERLGPQVRCAQRQWPTVVKALVCPFL